MSCLRCLWCPPRVFALFFFVLCTLWCGIHHVFLFCFSSSCVPYGVVSTTCFCFVFLRPVYPMVWYPPRVFVLVFFVLCTLWCGVHHVFLFCFSSSCVSYVVVFFNVYHQLLMVHKYIRKHTYIVLRGVGIYSRVVCKMYVTDVCLRSNVSWLSL
jgi:hypothetical protein